MYGGQRDAATVIRASVLLNLTKNICMNRKEVKTVGQEGFAR